MPWGVQRQKDPVSLGPAPEVSWNCFPLKAGPQEARQVKTVPCLPPLQNGVENASPTGLLRTLSDAQEQAHGPVATVGS